MKLPEDAFKADFGRDKPNNDTEIIFSCKMGGRAAKASEVAESLGFVKYDIQHKYTFQHFNGNIFIAFICIAQRCSKVLGWNGHQNKSKTKIKIKFKWISFLFLKYFFFFL